jgi:hypothetical protein
LALDGITAALKLRTLIRARANFPKKVSLAVVRGWLAPSRLFLTGPVNPSGQQATEQPVSFTTGIDLVFLRP